MKLRYIFIIPILAACCFWLKAQNWSDARGVMFWPDTVLTHTNTPPATNWFDAYLALWYKLNDSPATDPVYSGYEADSSVYTNVGALQGNWSGYLTGNLIEVFDASPSGVVTLYDNSYAVPTGEWETFTNVPNLTSNLVLVGGIQIFTVDGVGDYTNTSPGYMYDKGPFISGQDGTGGLRFTGGDTNHSIESIETPNSDSLQLTNTSGTIMCWVKLLVDGDTSHPFYFTSKAASDPGGGVDGYFFGITPNPDDVGRFVFFAGVGDQSVFLTNSIYGLTSSNWMHVAVTWDNTYMLRFYTNSVLQKTAQLSVLVNPTACASNLFIGKPDTGSAGLAVDLDDLRIYGATLGSNDIQTIWSGGAK